MCEIRSPPSATFRTCMPRQTHMIGMSRSSAARAITSSNASRSWQVP
jgi:hypothetical protein